MLNAGFVLRPFAVYDRSGKMVHLGLYKSSDETWQIYLGWPSASEIADAKSRGFVVLPVKVEQCEIITDFKFSDFEEQS